MTMGQRDWSNSLLVASSFHSCCWGDSCVIFDLDSGNTHSIRRDDLLFLEALRAGPQSFQALNAISGGPQDPDSTSYLVQLLETFESLGLVKISSSSVVP